MYNNKQLNDEQLKKELNKLLQNIEFEMETKNNNEIIEI